MYYGIRQNNKYKDINIYRPYIDKHKKELVAYCKKHKIAYGLDETNQDPKFTRNKIRIALSKVNSKDLNKLIKEFKAINKDLEVIEQYTIRTYKI